MVYIDKSCTLENLLDQNPATKEMQCSVGRYNQQPQNTLPLVQDLFLNERGFITKWSSNANSSIEQNMVIQKTIFDDLNPCSFVIHDIISQQSNTLGFMECYIAGTIGVISEALAAPAPAPAVRPTQANAVALQAPAVQTQNTPERPVTPSDFNHGFDAYAAGQVAFSRGEFVSAAEKFQSAKNRYGFFIEEHPDHPKVPRARRQLAELESGGRYSPSNFS